MEKILYIDYSLYEMFFIFVFWSAIGWLIEVADMFIEAGEFQNRGFLHMPLCPIYGLGMLLLCVILKDVTHSYPVLFICGMTVCTVFEYFVGWLLEKLFNARWWDYSHMRFNLKGCVCLRNAVFFGLGTILVIVVIEPFIERVIGMIPVHFGLAAITLISAALIMDVITSVRKAYAYGKDKNKPFVIFKLHR